MITFAISSAMFCFSLLCLAGCGYLLHLMWRNGGGK